MPESKSRFVLMQNFVRCFSRPRPFWFLSDSEIEGLLHSYEKPFQKARQDFEIVPDLDEQIEFDPVELFLQETKIDLKKESNPKSIEGKIIFEKFTEFLKNYCKLTMNVSNFVDFDQKYPDAEYLPEKKCELVKKDILGCKAPTLFFKPIFAHGGALAAPVAIVCSKPPHSEIIFIKGGTGTKRSDVLKHYFQIEITKKNIPLIDGLIFLFSREKKPKGHISFTVTNEIFFTKQTKRREDVKREASRLEDLEQFVADFKSGKHVDLEKMPNFSSLTNKIEETSVKVSDLIKGSEWDEFKFVVPDPITNQPPPEQILRARYAEFLKEYRKITVDFWKIIQEIKAVRPENRVSVSFGEAFGSYWDKFPYQKLIRQIWGKDNPIFQYSGKIMAFEKAIDYVQNFLPDSNVSLETYLNFKFLPPLISFYEQFLDLCGKEDRSTLWNFRYWPNQQFRAFYPDRIAAIKEFYDASTEIKSKTDETWFELIRYRFRRHGDLTYQINQGCGPRPLKKNKIYFDFETINPAIRIIDNSLPFAQIVTQCSVIKQRGDSQDPECVNLIIDPQKMTLGFFRQIVDALYEPDVHNHDYVVYNASFEITRLNEIKQYLDDAEYGKKIDAIVDNIYDLADWFNVNSKDWHIWIAELFGFHSIKNVLAITPKRFLDETKTKSYKSLNVQHGYKAQTLTHLRALGAVSDREWAGLSKDLQEYCENDVRAMIAVERFGSDLVASFDETGIPIGMRIFRILAAGGSSEEFQALLDELRALPADAFASLAADMEKELRQMKKTLGASAERVKDFTVT